MKSLMVVCMAVAFMAAAIGGGCSSTKPFGPAMTTGGEGAAKEPIPTKGAVPSGAITTGGEGAAKEPMPMGTWTPSGAK